jgi:hypothetical protein
MGSPPPPDAPAVDVQTGIVAEASFEASPTGPQLCGFGLPSFSLSINIPFPPFPPPFPPPLNLVLALVCDLDNPIDAELSFGGGRVAQPIEDPDLLDE